MGDIEKPAEARQAIAEQLDGAADLLTCDLGTEVSGIKERDQAQHRELVEINDHCRAILKPSGVMVAKLFMGAEFEALRNLFRDTFIDIEIVRAKASRPGSSELYIVAKRLRDSRPQATNAG